MLALWPIMVPATLLLLPGGGMGGRSTEGGAAGGAEPAATAVPHFSQTEIPVGLPQPQFGHLLILHL